jgi:hypothetical protein
MTTATTTPPPIPPQRPASQAEIRALEILQKKLWNDAELGPKVQKIAKELYPDVTIDEDAFAPIISPLRSRLDELSAELKAERESRAAEKKATEEAQRNTSMEQQLEVARKKYSLTDEGFKQMTDRMIATGSFDAEAAGAWVVQSAPPKEVTGPTWMPQDLNLFGSKDRDESLALLHKDPAGKFFDSEVREMLRDPDKYVRETFGAAA